MAIFDIFRRKKSVEEPEERNLSIQGLSFNTISSYNTSKALKLSAVYAAVNQISNSIATLALNVCERGEGYNKVIKHNLSDLLNSRPDGKNSHFNMFKMLIESVLLRGSGYAYIERDDRLNVKRLIYLNYEDVQPMPQEDGTIKYLVNGVRKAVDAEDMIDLHMHVDEMYRGISVIRFAAQTLATTTEAEKQAESFFKGGNNLAGVINVKAPLTTEQKKELINNWKGTFNNSSEHVPVAVLPQNVEYHPISVSPADAQLLDSRMFSILEIARFFLIPPSKLFVFDNESYNSLEYCQLMYLQDTLLPYVQMIEDEFNTKLFRPSERGKRVVDFDFSVLMSASKEVEANYYRSLITNGILTINEARQKLGFDKIEGIAGDCNWVQISYASANDIAEGKYIKANSQDQNQKVDNKVKGANNEENTEE